MLPKPVPVPTLMGLLSTARRDGLVALVEDDPALADNLSEVLRARGFSCVTARSVLETEQLSTVRPFAALVDLRLPGGPDGEALRRLRARFPEMPTLRHHRVPGAGAAGVGRRSLRQALRHRRAAAQRWSVRTPRPHPGAACAPSWRSPRVLVVDDNAAFLDNLQELLSDAGYEVVVATSCQAARERAKEGFDVALVDLRLPDGDGTALAAELKAGDAGRPRWCCSPASPPWRRRWRRCARARAPT